jgi:hypothetical protein
MRNLGRIRWCKVLYCTCFIFLFYEEIGLFFYEEIREYFDLMWKPFLNDFAFDAFPNIFLFYHTVYKAQQTAIQLSQLFKRRKMLP